MTNYRKHLWYEDDKNSREWQLQKCYNILGLVARVKDKIDDCRRFMDSDGILKNRKILERLEIYYQNEIKKIK